MLTKDYLAKAGKWGCVFLLSVSLLFPAATYANSANPDQAISVKLVNFIGNPNRLTLELSGEYFLSGASLSLSQGVYELRVENNAISLYHNGQALSTGQPHLSLQPSSNEQILKLGHRSYLGTMNFTLENGTTIRPVNTLSIENYVKGVIPNEMPASWNIEAQKAQAIAIRTYAMRRQHQVIDDTTNFQVYGGHHNYVTSIRAVDETRGQVLNYQGELVEAVYSSSNGGKTEASGSLWKPVEYLLAQVDPYDPKNPWTIKLSKQQIDLSQLDLSLSQLWWTTTREQDFTLMSHIKVWLQQNGWAGKDIKIYSIPTLEWANVKTGGDRETMAMISIDFLTRDSLGNIEVAKFERSNLPLAELRKMLGGNQVMKSFYVDPIIDHGDAFTVQGKGFGHGVGMSQYGAKSMADQGLKVERIISFYYPGTTLSQANIVPVTTVAAASLSTVSTQTTSHKAVPLAAMTAPALSAKPLGVKPEEKPKPVVVSRSSTPTVQGKIHSTVVVGVRTTPSFQAKPHSTVKNGQAIQVIGKQNRWIQIRAGNITGFVPDNYVQISK
ncbi:SpoIID/LytB domain-containing protein [Ammoniphilus sp. CFH 90114]|uniref:SpoIID/LytB domain-containing protein n=1 Tax=Ammoniphilus sp. CFH 90114 TaxID=2493665 RepID=UPI00100F6DC8|nr:SpoIID/LytB domain-containing protein [Ammoniphilus sp. CFH 90114]RXT09101.1 SpoIID/LytB domain-containing protein [Ammoniphilus sp. CFH 90114]